MRKNIFPLVLSLLLVSFTSCSSDSSDDMEPIPDPVSITYTNTIKSITTSSCATSACHDNTAPTAGISLTTYAGVKGAFESNGALSQIESGAMPKNNPKLSATTINKIKSWVAANYVE